jgi:hypothetical protein
MPVDHLGQHYVIRYDARGEPYRFFTAGRDQVEDWPDDDDAEVPVIERESLDDRNRYREIMRQLHASAGLANGWGRFKKTPRLRKRRQ